MCVPIALAARHVHHRFGTVIALDDVSLEVPAGTSVALVGQSGSGKTTLLRAFNRMISVRQGDVLVGGEAVTALEPTRLRRMLGYVQQRGGLLPHWTVAENVGLVLRASGVASDARAHAVAEAMALVGLDPGQFGARFPHELSGGQQQRVALARALAAKPEAILLDEPFGALDAITRAEVQDAFLDVRRQLAVTSIFVTHDLAEAARMADAIVVMRNGRIEQRGTIRELRDGPATEYVRALLERATSAARELVA